MHADEVKAQTGPTAEQILNGVFQHPAMQVRDVSYADEGFDYSRLFPVPEPGVHPRVLCSPEEKPDLLRRLRETGIGRSLLHNLRGRTGSSVRKAGTWEHNLIECWVRGEASAACRLLSEPKPSITGHYQHDFIYPLLLDAFDCWLEDDETQGQRIGAALAGYAEYLEPRVDEANNGPHADNIWRSEIIGIMKYQYVGLAYDFAYSFMTDEQRNTVRRLIAKATFGKITHGMELPAHWRNWNWMNVGQAFELLALAIEGEEGYDARIYAKSVEVMRDFLTYGISPQGSATEAVGYTAFGFVWAVPAMIAMARRGSNLFLHGHYRKMKDWYLHTLQPFGGDWNSHGDGGDGEPGFHMIQAMKYYYPEDPVVDYLWQNTVRQPGRDMGKERVHLLPAMLCAVDGRCGKDGKPVDYAFGGKLDQPNTLYDAERGSFITRNGWSEEAVVLQFECRCDSVSPSHEHADRGGFTLSALGQAWSRDGFRSVETKYHSSVLIDGKGQGYFPPPGRILGCWDTPEASFAVCDAKPAYDWFWPKTIVAVTDPDDPRLQTNRWASFREKSIQHKERYGDLPHEWEPTPHIRDYFKDYTAGDPRMWDEDPWTVRIPHNPVERAFRTAGLVRGPHTYSIIVDDIQKDSGERLYEWILMSGMEFELKHIAGNDVLIGLRSEQPSIRPGEPLLLLRVLEAAEPALAREFGTRPNIRMETFEKKDTFEPGGRSFGLDRRLVIGSRSIAPQFKVLLFPHKHGEPLPVTSWNGNRTRLLVEWADQSDSFGFSSDYTGRTRLEFMRAGKPLIRT